MGAGSPGTLAAAVGLVDSVAGAVVAGAGCGYPVCGCGGHRGNDGAAAAGPLGGGLDVLADQVAVFTEAGTESGGLQLGGSTFAL